MLDLLDKDAQVSTICRGCSRRIILTVGEISYLLESEAANPGYKFVVGRCDPCMWRILNGERYERQFRRGI
jgi:hypothetical protein